MSRYLDTVLTLFCAGATLEAAEAEASRALYGYNLAEVCDE